MDERRTRGEFLPSPIDIEIQITIGGRRRVHAEELFDESSYFEPTKLLLRLLLFLF